MMLETRLLRRTIHYIWACYRERGEMKIRLKNYRGDELHVEEQAETMKVFVRYFAKESSGELVKHIDICCFIAQHGEWLPLEIYQAGGLQVVYATVHGETQRIENIDPKGQAYAAGFCDTWAFSILEEGFLASAAKLNPLGTRAGVRPQWPKPTQPTPAFEQIEEWVWEDGGCEATDSCWVEVDGVCPHGHPSWLLRLGLV